MKADVSMQERGTYSIREMQPEERPLLRDFLYEAIYQREGEPRLPRSVIEEPALRVYVEGFGREKDDHCLVAQADETIVGAVWVRNIAGYGSVDEETPEFAISVLPAYRGLGIGTALMRRMLVYLKEAGYVKASLAVQKDNYALSMYRAVGFQTIGENDEEYIMVHDLKNAEG